MFKVSPSTTYSTIIYSRDGAETLRDTLQSLASQTLPSSQIIAINDGSTDDTEQIFREFKDHVRMIVNTHTKEL